MQNSPKFFACGEQSQMIFSGVHVTYLFEQVWHYVQINHNGHFASKASGPQKLQKYILRDLYASSLGKKNFSQGKLVSKVITVTRTL